MRFINHICFSLILAILTTFGCSIQVFARTSMAVLPARNSANTTPAELKEFEQAFYNGLIASSQYVLVDRSKLEEILKEQSLSMTGLIPPEKTVEVGELVEAEFIMEITLARNNGKFFSTLSVTSVTTGSITYTQSWTDLEKFGAASFGKWLAGSVTQRFPLTGQVVGISGSNIFVDLGSADGITEGSRLFVARREIQKSDDGTVLMDRENRIAILRVLEVSPNRSRAVAESLADQGFKIARKDLISPMPIPEKPLRISKTPLITSVKTGARLLTDGMDGARNLAPLNNQGTPYLEGRLRLDARHLQSGHAYAFYGGPLTNLRDYILEFDFRWETPGGAYDRICVLARSNGDYGNASGYTFWIKQAGLGELGYFQNGAYSALMPDQVIPILNSSPYAVNRMKIVFSGSCMDVYINGTFWAGMENEKLEQGMLGFLVNSGAAVSIDNVNIWGTGK